LVAAMTKALFWGVALVVVDVAEDCCRRAAFRLDDLETDLRRKLKRLTGRSGW